MNEQLNIIVDLIRQKSSGKVARSGYERIYIYEAELTDTKMEKLAIYSALKKLKSHGLIVNSEIVFGYGELSKIPQSKTRFLFSSWKDEQHPHKAYMLEINLADLKQLALMKPDIYYNKESGVGYVNGKRFAFKNHKPEYDIFRNLYIKMNKLYSSKFILGLLGKSIKSPSAYHINAAAKEIRKKTGLTTESLVLNNGNLILIGNKLKHPPI